MKQYNLIALFLIVLPVFSSCTSPTSTPDTLAPVKKAAYFHHVHLNVTHPDSTIAFYEKFFGGTRIDYRGKSKAVFTEKSFILFDSVSSKPASNTGSSLWHIGWAGVDGHAEFQWRVHDGIDVEMPVTGFKLPHLADSVHYMYFLGPDHELIEVSTVNRNHRFEHIHLISIRCRSRYNMV